jgi:CheY-like chemotaxis protein
MMMKTKSANILLVEDDPADVKIIEQSFECVQAAVDLSAVEDGEEALQYLRKSERFESAQRPDLILLDLNLPKGDGLELLVEMKQDPDLKRIPVIVLSTSKAPLDIHNAYGFGANCYIKKPLHFDEFKKVAGLMSDFWFGVVTLPHR